MYNLIGYVLARS